VRSSAPPRRIAARLSRAGLIAAGATAAAIAASGCGDMATADYGGPGLPYDDDASIVLADASVVTTDAKEDGDAMRDDAEGGEAGMAMTDAADGGPALEAGSDAGDGE
jgi:hypothetical protein